MKAILIHYQKEEQSDGSIVEMVIWQVPSSKERPHGFKYRLHYGSAAGICFVRYDNERGKGDHRHIGNVEEVYHFKNVEQLIKDFIADITTHKREQIK